MFDKLWHYEPARVPIHATSTSLPSRSILREELFSANEIRTLGLLRNGQLSRGGLIGKAGLRMVVLISMTGEFLNVLRDHVVGICYNPKSGRGSVRDLDDSFPSGACRYRNLFVGWLVEMIDCSRDDAGSEDREPVSDGSLLL